MGATLLAGAMSLHPEFVSQLSAHGAEAAWRLNGWNLLERFLQMSPPVTFEVGLSRILLALQKGDEAVSKLFSGKRFQPFFLIFNASPLQSYHDWLCRTRNIIMGPLAAASCESYQRAYPSFIKLQMLQEIEQMRFVRIH